MHDIQWAIRCDISRLTIPATHGIDHTGWSENKDLFLWDIRTYWISLYHLVNLCSAFRIFLDFQMLLYNFSFSSSGHFFHTVSFHISWGGATSSEINSMGNIQIYHLIWGNTSFSFGLSMQHSFTQSHMASISMMVGHLLVVYTFFMCTSHIGITTHTPAFYKAGDHSGNLLCTHMA